MPGLQRHIRPIVVEQIHLDISIRRQIQTNLTHHPRCRIELRRRQTSS